MESLLFRARQRLRVQLRTVYASVSGASWVDALVRLFVGGGAPVAAKVAVLGAGAAVVGSTAVVVPNVLENHRPSLMPRIDGVDENTRGQAPSVAKAADGCRAEAGAVCGAAAVGGGDPTRPSSSSVLSPRSAASCARARSTG